jgi:hypothetical protein
MFALPMLPTSDTVDVRTIETADARDAVLSATYDAIAAMATRQGRRPFGWRSYSVPGGKPAQEGQRSPMLLTNTSKMPCPSWSLPAGKACPGAKYGAGTICGSCYAKDRGMYLHEAVKNAQRERFTWTRALMRTPAGRDAFVEYLTMAIRATGLGYFRVHDSGDLFSPAYTACWRRIAGNLPGVKFWFPTRSYRIPALLPGIVTLAGLANVTVRPSALFLDATPPVITGLSAGSGATYSEDDATCPAYRQDGRCMDCRSCWDRPDRPVLYPLH